MVFFAVRSTERASLRSFWNRIEQKARLFADRPRTLYAAWDFYNHGVFSNWLELL